MIEVFKTNIRSKKDALLVLSKLQTIFPESSINIDLQDCDKVLRIETYNSPVDEKKIEDIFQKYNFNLQVLDC